MNQNDHTILKALQNIMEEFGIYIDNENTSINIDSIQFVSLIIEIENHFNISILAEALDIRNLKTLNDYKNLVEQQLSSS